MRFQIDDPPELLDRVPHGIGVTDQRRRPHYETNELQEESGMYAVNMNREEFDEEKNVFIEWRFCRSSETFSGAYDLH